MIRTSHIFSLLLLCAAFCFAAAEARADVITFDDGTDGAGIGNFYLARGVTFSNAAFADNFGAAGSSGALGLAALSNGFNPPASNPIRALFGAAQGFVSIRALDVGAGGARLNAFDANNNLLGFSSATGTGNGFNQFFTLSVTALGIRRIELFQINPGAQNDGVLFDTLDFRTSASAVPEPATLLLLGTGLAGLAAGVRRLR